MWVMARAQSLGWSAAAQLSSLIANRDREHIPCGVRQPLLAPSFFVFCGGHRDRQVEIYIFIMFEACRDAVDDTARRVLVFPGIEEHIVRVVASHAVQHRDIEGVQAENPIELIEREGLQLVLKRRVVSEVFRGKPRPRRHRAEARVFPLPPWGGFGVVRIKETRAADSGLILHELAAVTERVGDLARYPE